MPEYLPQLKKMLPENEVESGCKGIDEDKKGGKAKPAIKKLMADDGAQPSEMIGTFDTSVEKMRPGPAQAAEGALVACPGEEVGKKCDKQKKGKSDEREARNEGQTLTSPDIRFFRRALFTFFSVDFFICGLFNGHFFS